MKKSFWSIVICLGLGAAGCAAGGVDELAADGPPCGIALCVADEPDTDIPDYVEPGGGKADADDVASAIARMVTDGVLDADDVRAAFEATGNRVSRSEVLVIRDAVESDAYEVTDDAKSTALSMARLANLFEYEVDHLSGSDASYGGSEIPGAVQDLIARARLNGAIAYDVQEQNDEGEGVWNPYPSTTPPVENMTFEHTEITPWRLAEDRDDAGITYNAIVGSEAAEYCNGSGTCQEYETARYEARTGGTGNITAHYDHVYHEDLFARGRSGQIWASNCAILSDGAVHCLPAARRSALRDLILTNPHLSRCNGYQGFETGCKHLLYHGHITARAGVITSIEVSGRLSKRVARDRASIVDPIAVLEAWGFEISPSLSIRYGNTEEGRPVRDLERGVLIAEPEEPEADEDPVTPDGPGTP